MKIFFPASFLSFLLFFLFSPAFSSDNRLFYENHSLAKKAEQIVFDSWMKNVAPVITPEELSKCSVKYSEATSRFYREIRRKEEHERTGFTERVRNMVFNHVSLWDCGEYIQTHPYMPSFHPPGQNIIQFMEYLKSVNYSGWPLTEQTIYFGNSPDDSAALISYLGREEFGSDGFYSGRDSVSGDSSKNYSPRFHPAIHSQILPVTKKGRPVFNALSALHFKLWHKQEVEGEKLNPGELSFISKWNEMNNKLLKVSGGYTTGKKTESPMYK
ncbi:MAG: hypothetical protein ACOZCO_10840 [Bacteroidota bacterium]